MFETFPPAEPHALTHNTGLFETFLPAGPHALTYIYGCSDGLKACTKYVYLVSFVYTFEPTPVIIKGLDACEQKPVALHELGLYDLRCRVAV
jgi:hypothetical protein